jgi:hypothetical protein
LKMEVFWKIIKEVIPEFNNKKEQPKMWLCVYVWETLFVHFFVSCVFVIRFFFSWCFFLALIIEENSLLLEQIEWILNWIEFIELCDSTLSILSFPLRSFTLIWFVFEAEEGPLFGVCEPPLPFVWSVQWNKTNWET